MISKIKHIYLKNLSDKYRKKLKEEERNKRRKREKERRRRQIMRNLNYGLW